MPHRAFNEKDVLIVAHMLVERHGAGAASFASGRVEEFASADKPDGRMMWRRILLAVQAMGESKRGSA